MTQSKSVLHGLVDYVHAAQQKRIGTIDCSEAVEMVAKGICKLIEILLPKTVTQFGHMARWLQDALQSDISSIISLRHLLWAWCIEETPVMEKDWTNHVIELRRILNPIIGSKWSSDADAFCQWSMKFAGQISSPNNERIKVPNVYRFSQNGRYADINVGTIHSAKGQTHTATLVLETYYKKHDMEDLLPWICDKYYGGDSSMGPERTERMRLVFTAMTCPSHLLCLALRRDALKKADMEIQISNSLERLGWTIKDLIFCEQPDGQVEFSSLARI